MVLDAIRRVGLPLPAVRVQPAEETLVNLDTIFYTDQEAFTTDVVLLGQQVAVEATPIAYLWDHGDGTTSTSTDPGAAYPRETVTHRYQRANDGVTPAVATTWQARFSVEGGGWQDIDETLTVSNTGEPLEVVESVALLSGQD